MLRLPATTDRDLLRAIPRMQVGHSNPENGAVLGEPGHQYLAYVNGPTEVLDLSHEKGTFELRHIDLKTGAVRASTKGEPGKKTDLPKSGNGPAVFWLVKDG